MNFQSTVPHPAELIPAVGGSISFALEEQIFAIEQQLNSLKNQPIDDLVDDFSGYAKGAAESASAALTSAQYAIVYAWAGGSVLNLAKDILGRGSFGKWRDAKARECGISVRTVQNWMKLAKGCWDVRALLIPGASLTTAYRVAGVLPEAESESQEKDKDDDGEGGDKHPDTSRVTELAFTALAEVCKRLRRLVETARILENEERDRLEEEKFAFISLIDKLLNPIVP